jgi:hypothetical protein
VGRFALRPSSPSGIAFAAVANAMLWLVALWLALVLYRTVQRRLAAFHQ